MFFNRGRLLGCTEHSCSCRTSSHLCHCSRRLWAQGHQGSLCASEGQWRTFGGMGKSDHAGEVFVFSSVKPHVAQFRGFQVLLAPATKHITPPAKRLQLVGRCGPSEGAWTRRHAVEEGRCRGLGCSLFGGSVRVSVEFPSNGMLCNNLLC